MSKDLDRGKNARFMTSKDQALKVNINEQPVVICTYCKGQYFKPVVKIRKVSHLLFGGASQSYLMEQFFECVKCEAIICTTLKKESGFKTVPPDKE